MFNYIVRRILILIPVLFGITIVSFLIIHMAPGSPVDLLVDPTLPEELIEAKKEELGLNDPLYIQYYHWLTNVLQGNLGYSMSTYEPVLDMVVERIGPTMLLMGTALLLGVLIAIPFGVLSAIKQNSLLDYFLTGISFMGISVPNFFLALGLVYIFALQLNLLPTSGMNTMGQEGNIWDTLLHLILPSFVLAVTIAGKKIRYVRSSVLETLGEDYLRTARAKGLSEFVVIGKHALRNALVPVITVIGLEIPILVGGSVVIEQIFSWPGLGQLTISSILARDYPTLMAINLLTATVVAVANLVIDIIYSIVDPRIKFE